MNLIRRSHWVLSKFCKGVRPVYHTEERRRIWTEARLTAFTHQHSKGGPDFKELHSHTTINSGGDTDGGVHSRGQTAHLNQQQQRGEEQFLQEFRLLPLGSVVFNLDVMVSLLRQENAEDICVIKVPEELKYTEFFIVVSGSSTRHLRAMALYAIKVYKFMKRDKDPHVHVEGKDAEDWMCIDFGSMVVHLMLPETRATYELEKLWTLRSYDEQVSSIPPQSLPADFIYDAEIK